MGDKLESPTGVETPVEHPALKPDAPLVTDAQLIAARTSHLSALPPNPDTKKLKLEDAGADDEPLTLSAEDTKFPKTLKAAVELRKEIQSTQAKSPRDQKLKNLRLRALNTHIFTLEQVPQPPPIIGVKHDAIANVQTDHAKAIHLETIARQFPVVRELLNSNAKLAEENEGRDEFVQKFNALQSERNALAAENAKLTAKVSELTAENAKLTAK
jgi:hypothetical protein